MNNTLTQYCLSHEYHFLGTCARMMCMRDTNKDIDNYKQEFSIEHILVSIKKLKARVKILEARRVYEVPQTNVINQNNEEVKNQASIHANASRDEPQRFYEQHEVENIHK